MGRTTPGLLQGGYPSAEALDDSLLLLHLALEQIVLLLELLKLILEGCGWIRG